MCDIGHLGEAEGLTVSLHLFKNISVFGCGGVLNFCAHRKHLGVQKTRGRSRGSDGADDNVPRIMVWKVKKIVFDTDCVGFSACLPDDVAAISFPVRAEHSLLSEAHSRKDRVILLHRCARRACLGVTLRQKTICVLPVSV